MFHSTLSQVTQHVSDSVKNRAHKQASSSRHAPDMKALCSLFSVVLHTLPATLEKPQISLTTRQLPLLLTFG